MLIDDPSRRAALSRTLGLLLLPAVAHVTRALADEQRRNIRLLTITYPSGAASKFDPSYYRDHHLGLFMDIYGPAIERFELRTVPSSQTFSAVINIWIADYELFKVRSTAAAYQRMGDDKQNFTNTSSYVEVDEVRYEAGEQRSSITLNTTCLSLLYPTGAGLKGTGGHWDDDKHCRAYVDGLMSLLGSKSVQRIELRRGIEQLDEGAPNYQGGINIYSRDPREFAAAWRKHSQAAQRLSTQLCDAQPVELSTTVFGLNKP